MNVGNNNIIYTCVTVSHQWVDFLLKLYAKSCCRSKNDLDMIQSNKLMKSNYLMFRVTYIDRNIYNFDDVFHFSDLVFLKKIYFGLSGQWIRK